MLGRFSGNPVHESCGWLVSCLIGAYQDDLQEPSIASFEDTAFDWRISDYTLSRRYIYGLCARRKLVVKGDDILKPCDVTQDLQGWRSLGRQASKTAHRRADACVSHRKTRGHNLSDIC